MNPEHSPERDREYESSLIEHAKEEFDSHRTELGRGRSAIVWHGKAPEFDKDLCFKTIHNSDMETNALSGEFTMHEAFQKAGVRVPKLIAHVSDIADGPFGADGFLAMERINGRNLEEEIAARNDEQRPFTKEELQRLIADMTEQVAKAHKANVHHRDLHLGNVMINEHQELVIIDFGRARRTLSSEEASDIYHGQIVMEGRVQDARFLSDDGLPTRFIDKVKKEGLFPSA